MSEQLPLWSSHPSTSSPGDSPAKTSRGPARALDSTESAPASGGSIAGSSPPSALPSPSSKTSPRVKAGGCVPCGGVCTNSDTTRPLCKSPRGTSGHLTSGNGSSLWPTSRARDHKGPGFGDDLPAADRRGHTWPSPTARDATSGPGHGATMQGGPSLRTAIAATWPTPTAQDAKLSGVQGNWTPESGRNSGTTLTDAAVREGQRSCEGKALNPAWVEALMGFPPGWTEIQASLFDGPPAPASPNIHGSPLEPPDPCRTETSG